jgi:Glycosidases
MLDRFSNGMENGYRDNAGALVTTGSTPLFQTSDRGNATSTQANMQRWVEAGNKFVGRTLRGLQSKIGCLERLGISAIWISPVFKQVPSQETFHGYGIQNVLDVDPRFGTRADLVSVVRTCPC